MVSFSKINSFFRKAYNKSLFASNVTTCMVLLGAGDCFTQYVEHKTIGLNSTADVVKAAAVTQVNTQMSLTNTSSGFSVDWSRCMKMFAVGSAVGPFQHVFYTFLDKKFPKKTKTVILKKLFIDQLFAASMLNLILIAGIHLLDGQKLSALPEAFKEKFLTLYFYDCILWIPAQLLNFNFVSPTHRVLYINLVTLIWNTISSFVMFNDVSLNSTFE